MNMPATITATHTESKSPMTLTIHFPEEKAAVLKAQAELLGLTVEEWLFQLADQQSEPTAIAHLQKSNPKEWARQFRSWADGHDASLPVLSDQAMSRDSIYPDRS